MEFLQKILKNQKGSITIFVLTTLLLFTTGLSVTYVNISNKNSAQIAKVQKIQEEYEQKSNEEAIEEEYHETVERLELNVNILFYKSSGETYKTSEWTKESIYMELVYNTEVNEEDKYFYIDNTKVLYTGRYEITDNCTIKVANGDKTVTKVINKIDKEKPTAELNRDGGIYLLPQGDSLRDISTKITASDAGSGIKNIQYAWSTSKTVKPADSSYKTIENEGIATKENCTEGSYYLWLKLTDNVGNSEEQVSSAFKVTGQSPITMTKSTDSWTNQDIEVTIEKEDGIVGEITLAVTGQDGKDYEINDTKDKVIIKTNNQTITVTITEPNGIEFKQQLVVSNIDKTLPTVSLSQNGGNYTIPTGKTVATIKTKLTAADEGGSTLNTLKYAWSTSKDTAPTAWTTFTNGKEVSKADCTEGTYYLWTNVTDIAGNTATSVRISNAFSVTANTTAANKITLTQSPTGWTNQDITVTVSYGSNLTQNRKAGLGSASTANATSVAVTANGTVYAEATDIAGNKVTASLQITTIDKDKPTAPIITNPSNGEWTKDAVTISVETTDAASKVSKIEYSYNNSTWKTDWGTDLVLSGNTATIKGTWNSNYNITIYVRAIDNAGNVSEVSSTVLKQDKTAPSATSCEVKNLTTTGYDVYVYGVSDSGSGINRVQFPTWTEANGQDDIQSSWSTNSAARGTKQSDGTTWVYHVNVADHKNEYGKYSTHVYVYDNLGQQKVLTTTAEVPGVTITYDYQGTKNYAKVNDSGKTMTGFTGASNYCPGLYTLETDGLKENDKVTMSFDIEYTNLTVDTTQSYRMRPQGSGNETGWSPGIYFSQINITGTGTYHYEASTTMSATMLTNATFSLNLRTDYYTGGTLKITNFKVTRTTKETVTKGYGSQLGTLPSITEVGYTFNGWYTAKTGGTKISTSTTVPASNTTYYAQYTVNQYTVSCEDWFVDASNNKKVKIAIQTNKSYDYGSIAKGSDWGTENNGNYRYHECTQELVGTSGTTVYRYYYVWVDVNILNPSGTQDYKSAYFSLSNDNTNWDTKLTNESSKTNNLPYGTVLYIKDLEPYYEYYEYDSCSGCTYADSQWTYTVTGPNTMVIKMKYKSYNQDLNYIVDGTWYYSGYNSRIQVGLKIGGVDKGYVNDFGGSYQYGTAWEIYGAKLDGVTLTSYQTSGTVGTGNSLNFTFYTIAISPNNSSYGSVDSSSIIVWPNETYSTSSNKLTISDGRKVTATATTATGYTTSFSSWSSTSGTITAKTTITANFSRTAHTYTIEYNANGGTGTTASSTHTYGVEKALTTNGFTKTGYSFLGWSTNQSATTATYTNGQRVSNLSSTNGAKVILYAIWQDNIVPAMGNITYSPSTWTNGNVTITAKATDTGSGISYYQFSTSSSLTASSSGWTSITNTKSETTQTYSASANGTYYFYAKDASGNINKKSVALSKIDKTKPTITTPTASAVAETSITLSTTFNDANSGLSKIVVYYKKDTASSYSSQTTTYTTMNGSTTGSTGSQTKSISLTGLSDGTTYNIYVIGYDVAGNSIQSSTASIATLTSRGKTISDLYDGNNDWTDTGNYNEDAMHIGDYVNYTAGSWTETKYYPGTPYTFGGYTSGQSRDTNVIGITESGSNVNIESGYEGWRIWDISEDKQTITLISAGCPEAYRHPNITDGTKHAYISEYILTGNINTTAESLDLGLGSTYIAKDWSIYKNTNLYATNARAMQKSDLDTWYGKYIDSNITDSWNIDRFPLNTDNKLISTIENGFSYWLSSARNDNGLYYVNSYYRYVDSHNGNTYGVRVLVTLTSDVKFNETPEKVEQDGFSYNKWIIESN